jgi:hypothetical protein
MTAVADLCRNPDTCRCCVTLSGLPAMAARWYALTQPTPPPVKVSKPVKARSRK